MVRNPSPFYIVPLDLITKQKFTVNNGRRRRDGEDGEMKWMRKGGPRLSRLSEIPYILSFLYHFSPIIFHFSVEIESTVFISSLNHTSKAACNGHKKELLPFVHFPS